MLVRIDADRIVREFIDNRYDENGAPRYHPDIMKSIVAVPYAEIGWQYDELAMEAKPLPPKPDEPRDGRLDRMASIREEYLSALLFGNEPVARALETEYRGLAGDPVRTL